MGGAHLASRCLMEVLKGQKTMALRKSDVNNITMKYYSCFCCTDLSKLERGVHFICSSERDDILKGYGCKYPLYILQGDGLCVVTYAPAFRSFTEPLKLKEPHDIISAAGDKYRLKKMRLLIFQEETVLHFGDAKVLSAGDYPAFEAFFRETHKRANPDGWLQEYFIEKASKGYFTGYFKDGCLVSVCDAPDVPYMEGKIQHTGIMTLEEERRKGYGKLTAALATHQLLQAGICPQWECNVENAASFELAKSIGYREFATAYILEG